MTTDLTLEEKQQTLTNGFDECMKHHLCGNYISMSNVEGLQDFLMNEVNNTTEE